MNPPWFRKRSVHIKNVKRVLIVHPYGIGDVLFITPTIRALKEHGVSEIDLLLGNRTKELFQHHPLVHRIFVWDKSELQGFWSHFQRVLTLVRLFWRLWRNRYHVLIDCSLAHQYAFLGWILWWIPVRLGFNFKRRGIFLTHQIDLPEAFKDKPVPEYYRDLLSFLGIENVLDRLELFLSQVDASEGDRMLKRFGITPKQPYCVVVPGGGQSWGKDARLKRWPPSHFAQLIRLIRSQGGVAFDRVLILGSAAERSIGDRLSDGLRGFEVHNLCGVTSIRTSAVLIQNASFLLGNDSGLIHVAHSVQTPLIAIYGPVNPLVYGPYPKRPTALAITNTGPACRPCYQKMRYQADCVGIECLTELASDHVFHMIRADGFFERLDSKVAAEC